MATAPTPAVMAGRRDPALEVRPVDYHKAAREHAQRSIHARKTQAVQQQNPDSSHNLSAAERHALAQRIMDALCANTSLTASDSLYSVVSGQPVPTGYGLELVAPQKVIDVVGAWEATLDDLQRCVDDPDDTWTSDVGNSDYFLRGNLCVRVRRRDAHILGIYRSGWALARKPEEALADDTHPHRSVSGGQGTRYPTNRAELLKRLRSAGFVVTTSGSTHGKITHPDHPGRFLPYSSTPSGQRYGRHVVTAVRRVFGIDLRVSP